MWELDYKESWVLKNLFFWAVVLEKTLESPLDCKKIQPIHPKGNQSRIFIGRIDAEAEAPILWPSDAKNWLIRKDPHAGKELKAEEGDDREWDGWIVSLTGWTWAWASSGSWWWTGRPGVLQSIRLQRVRQLRDWTELNFSYFIGSCHFRSNAKMMVINGARPPDKNENCGGCVSSNDSFCLGTDGNISDAL